MKYAVALNINATLVVEVEAESPSEAFERADYRDADIKSADDINVHGYEPIGCEDEGGNYTEYSRARRC